MPVLDAVQTFVGIANENEFYSHHYLAEVFKGDIKARLDAWEATESERPGDEARRAPNRRQGLLNEDGDLATPFRRLKLVMDYWCALWFWPIAETHRLPSREEWWMEIGAILEGNILDLDP